MQRETPTIVIVDDASEVRQMLRTRFRLSGRLAVVGEGADGSEAVELAREHQPALMLLDVSMPVMDGLQALPLVLAVSPGTRVVMFSGFEEQRLIEKADRLGAATFIEKSAPLESLPDRLLAVLGVEASSVPPGVPPVAVPVDSILDEHLERFREVFDQAAIGMATMTLTGRLVRSNSALAALLRRPVEDLVGLFYGELTDGRADLVTDALEDIRRRPLNVVQLEHGLAAAADGRWLQVTLAPVRDSGGRALYVFLQVQDVTVERAAAEELRKSEERFRLLVEAVEDYAIFMLDPTGHVVSWNSGAQRSKGYAASEIIGQHFRVFYPPEVRARRHPEHELELALRHGTYEEEGWRLRKDGSRFWATVLITAVYDASGQHIGFAKVTRDTTDRRRLEQDREQAVEALASANAELGSLNTRLRQAAEEQSQFLAVTAHELRTPVTVLSGTADTLAKHWAEMTDEERLEMLDGMASSTGRLRRLLADLLTASRLKSSVLEIRSEPVRVGELVDAAVAAVRRAHPDAEIHWEGATDLEVVGDRDRLAQALDNLLGNALQHGVPPIRVSVTGEPDRVVIRVEDHGAGVPERMRPRLFERFATGRPEGGTGLGLFIVRELARMHGGDARYERPSAERPAGAFVLSLPSSGEKPPPPQGTRP